MKIIPAILAKTYEEFESMVRKIEPYADLVQLDVADGQFVPNKTIDGYEELMRIETKLDFEIHLMIKNPEKVIGYWLKTPAARYLIHLESAKEPETLINRIKEGGKELGLVLNPETDYSAIEPYLDKIDLVQFMTVDPGFYGSPFLPDVLEKIRNFHGKYPGKIIQVDGGINPETIKLAEEAGASRAAVGSYIFESQDIQRALKELNV
ncbi:MAG: ribulose-phosphate 3-epimerase [Parcubacteria group bacterium]|nr:ribulose-phosphate 3-epimerase [Parcubacteria group bacterium]